MSINELQTAVNDLTAKMEKHWGQIPTEIAAEVAGLKQIVNDLLLRDTPAKEAPVEPPTVSENA